MLPRHAVYVLCSTCYAPVAFYSTYKILRRPLAAEVEVVKVRATLSHLLDMLIMLLLVLPSIPFLLGFFP